LAEILSLWGSIAMTIKTFKPLNRWAAYLLIPYLAWVSFATLLNLMIVVLN
jgi:tryptophan-rich sensory protein